MTNVDKWENSLEETLQEEQDKQRELWQELKEREPFQSTANKPRTRKGVAIKDIERNGNIRPDLPEVFELAESIKERGLIQAPLLAQSENGDFRLVAGFRRVEALLHLFGENHVVDCDIIEDLSDSERIALMLVENEQRKNIEPVVTARTLRDLMRKNEHTSASALARSLGLSSRWVQDRLRLLDLPSEVQKRISKGDLSFTVADLIRRKVEDGTIEPKKGEELSLQVADGEIKAGDLRSMLKEDVPEVLEQVRESTEDRPAVDLGFEIPTDEAIQAKQAQKPKTEEEIVQEHQDNLEAEADDFLLLHDNPNPSAEKKVISEPSVESRVSAGECIALAHCLSIYPDFAHKHGIENPWTEVPAMSKRQRTDLFQSLQKSVWVSLSEEFKQHFVFED